jgi:hypothetical protein
VQRTARTLALPSTLPTSEAQRAGGKGGHKGGARNGNGGVNGLDPVEVTAGLGRITATGLATIGPIVASGEVIMLRPDWTASVPQILEAARAVVVYINSSKHSLLH